MLEAFSFTGFTIKKTHLRMLSCVSKLESRFSTYFFGYKVLGEVGNIFSSIIVIVQWPSSGPYCRVLHLDGHVCSSVFISASHFLLLCFSSTENRRSPMSLIILFARLRSYVSFWSDDARFSYDSNVSKESLFFPKKNSKLFQSIAERLAYGP